MRVLQTKFFKRFARKNRISDIDLCCAVDDISKGIIDADLGGGVIKQRIARQGKGKSGGFRTILAFRSGRVACFLFGFAKSDAANVDARDLADLHELAADILGLSEKELNVAVKDGNLIEVNYHAKKLS